MNNNPTSGTTIPYVVLAAPVDVRDEDVAVNGKVGDGRERDAVLVLLDFLLERRS